MNPKKTERMGRPAKRWSVGGEQLTAKECADRVGVSVESLKKRLSRCGGDMEKAMSYYEKQKARTQNDTDAMVDQLVGAILGNEETEAEPMELSDAWTDPEEAPEGAITGGEDPSPEDLMRESLIRYNSAIDGLSCLMSNDLTDIALGDQIFRCLGALHDARALKFEALVPWHAIAEGGLSV